MPDPRNPLRGRFAQRALLLLSLALACVCTHCGEASVEKTDKSAEESKSSAGTTSPRDPRTPGTIQMAERLELLAGKMGPRVFWHSSEERRNYYQQQLRRSTEPVPLLTNLGLLARDLLHVGSTEQAIEVYRKMLSIVWAPELNDPKHAEAHAMIHRPAYIRFLHLEMAMAHLRMAENDNCIARPGPESCLLPIEGGGVHRVERGSRAAIAELREILDDSPDDVEAIWLLNLAYMTLGEYPQGVPDKWRIPPETFASDYDIKRFENRAAHAGIDLLGLAGGAILEDMDGDGDLDILASAFGIREQLRYLRNDGDGTFSELTEAAGLVGELNGLNMLHADYDNDGHPDALVLRGAWKGPDGHMPNSLLRNNGDATFNDVTEEVGLLSFHPTQTAAWADYNNDGWLDLFIGNETTKGESHPCELYRSNADGTFTDMAGALGVDNLGVVKGVGWGDYDNDGRPDLYLSRLNQANVLYHNDGPDETGSWHFSDSTAQAGVAEPLPSFPTFFFDYDNDGWLDLFVASYAGFSGNHLAGIVADKLGRPSKLGRAKLYRNRGNGTFEDVSAESGLDDTMLAMGLNFGDLDNDGFLDIYVGTGEPNLLTLVPNRMYRNDNGQRFQDVTTSGGFGNVQKGHAITFGDVDNDGDQDIYAVMGGAYPTDVAFNGLFVNPGHGNHWLTLKLHGVRANRSAIGATIRITLQTEDGLRELHRVVGTGGSFGSSSLRQEIGLGKATSLKAVDVRWPGRQGWQSFPDLEMDRAYTLREGEQRGEPLTLHRFEL